MMIHFILLSAFCMYCSGAPANLMIVDIGYSSSVDVPTKIAALTCAGLFNRNPAIAGPAYTLLNAEDVLWLAELENITNPRKYSVSLADFLHKCFHTRGIATGVVSYDYDAQKAIVPNIITLGGVLTAVPLEPGNPAGIAVPVVFDAKQVFAGFTPNQATSYMWQHFVNATTGMAIMDPGYTWSKGDRNPPLTGEANVGLTDYIVKVKLFNFYLRDGCIPLTADHSLMDTVVTHNPWPRPIAVMGYNDAWPFEGGDLFEAETDCVKAHNLGEVASDGCNNLAYFSSHAPITSPLRQNPVPRTAYNASKTYMALVVGDGDNLNYLKGGRYQWFKERLARCDADPTYKGCFPLLWSFSPQTLTKAPQWIQWYYNQSYIHGKDYFVLPPSGALYSYPAMMPSDVSRSYVAETERVATLMGTSMSVTWEWFYDWGTAIDSYLPQYSTNSIVKSFVPVDVPFMIPVAQFLDGEFFKVLGAAKNVVLFRPREWRGTGSTTIPFAKNEYLTPPQMAQEINEYPKGTVGAIYLTSDGGASLQTFYDLVPLLGEHVEIVDHQTIAAMALAAHNS